jgi:predicted amidohydrolase YtcJ
MPLRTRLALTLLLAAVCAPAALAPVGAARQTGRRSVGLILTGGKVFTADSRGTLAEAVAVEGNRIVAVGTSREIGAAYTAARTIDLKGRLVTPGFNDAHLHFLGGGLFLLRVNLVGSKTLSEAKARVAARVRELPAGAWVTGRGWDHTLWGGAWPTKRDLDEVAPNNPVILQRVDGHVSWANTLALQKANVTRETRAPQGGEILHDAAGEPTGILKETAGGLVTRVVPEPTAAEQTEALERALAEARRYGITSIQDNSGYETTKLYRELKRKGRLTVRVAEWQNFNDPVEELKRQRAEFVSFNDLPELLRLSAVKGYVDGTLGSRTSAMLAPFADDPHNSGIPRMPPEQLNAMVLERAREGFQITLHCIGDRANRMALDAYEAAYKEVRPNFYLAGRQDNPIQRGDPVETPGLFRDFLSQWVRFRVEHAQVVAPSDFARFRDLRVIASMQPAHAISDKRWAQDRLGEYRVLGAYSWHTFMAHGVPVPFGTDWPVEPINPYLGLYAAVTRRSVEGEPEGGWWPEERLTIADALRNYTTESAYASFEEMDKGLVAQYKLADLVVHSRDLLTIAPREILQTEADITVFNGRIVYERKEP